MSGWDVGLDGYDPDDSFVSMDNSNFSTDFSFNQDSFDSYNDTSFSNTISEMNVAEPPPSQVSPPLVPIIPIQQLTGASDCEQLAQENCKLREYFASLKDRAEKATSENEKLKAQLGKWREGFRSAMFSGMGIKK